MNQQGQAAALFKEALLDNPDDWTSLQHYLDCILTQASQVARNETGPKDHDQVNFGRLQLHARHQMPDIYTLGNHVFSRTNQADVKDHQTPLGCLLRGISTRIPQVLLTVLKPV